MLLAKNNDSLSSNWSNWTQRLFDDFNSLSSVPNTSMPAANVIEKDDSFTIKLAAPGIDKSEIKIELNDSVLSISGEKRTSSEDKEDNYTRREYSFSNFKRSFTLPQNINYEDISAHHENGELTLTIPKNGAAINNTKSIKIE